MNTFPKRLLCLMLILAGCGSSLFAQRVPKSITKRDEKNIRSAAEQTITNFINLLNTCADPDNTASDLDDAISNAFTSDSRVRIFFQNDFEADDDLDPSIPAGEALTKDIKAYLRQFRNFYTQNKALSVRSSITEISEIHVGESNLYLKVFFNQLMNGKDRKGAQFPSKMPKVAEMQIVSIGGQWQTLISHLDRQSKTDRNTNTPVVAISDAGDNSGEDAGGPQRSESYYRSQLQNGMRLLSENNYSDAYYSLKEAKRFQATEGDADARIKDLMSKMRAQNLEPTEYLNDALSSKGLSLQDKYRYDLARNYYSYAKEVRPAAAKNAAAAMLAISQLQAKEQLLYDLLAKGSYSEAAKGFSSALQKTPDNPSLQVGLARANAALGNNAEAEEAFAAAVRTDAGYPETYKWRGYYYKSRKDYRQAYDAFAAYQTRAEDTGDVNILSEMAFSRGMIARLQGNAAMAMDAFSAALQYNPNNVDVLIAQADLLRMQGDKGVKGAKKLIDDALRKDDKNPEAYAVKAHIFETEANKAGAADAYQAAIKFDKDNPQWYFELGKLQMELNDVTNGSAILTFTSCLNIRPATREDGLKQIQALWKRGKCYYLQNRLDEAEADYNNFVKQAKMLTNGFQVDYANLLIKRAKYDEALIALRKAGERPEALLSMGILNYTRAPGNEGGYEDYFTRAFRDGVSAEAVKSAPNMRSVYDNSAIVKSLMKKFKYNTDF